MSAAAIHVDHVSKRFPLGTRSSYLRLSETLTDGARRLLRAPWRWLAPKGGVAPADPEVWALRDVNFEVQRGEVLGIVGRNGAGKSTLLKILSRITRPTSGRVGVSGRVGSLLEVGTGFHPELTGRENIFLNGSVLGMTRREVQRKLADIVAFAEVERFLDTPVKRYSSGMYVRLAFAVAAHLEPEILLIDEVLAVGDAGFQKRCLGRMQDISRAGRTIVFVSHNMAAVTGLCTRALHLDRGQLAADGSPAEVVASYLGQHAAETLETVFDEASGVATEWLALHRVGVCRADGAAGPLTVRTPLRIETEFSTLQPHRSPNLSLLLYNAEGTCLFNAASPLMEVPAGRHVAAVEIPGDLLNNGLHRVRVLLGVDFIPQVDRDDALQFTVQDSERTIPVFVDWIGAVRPALPWTWRTVAPPWTGGQTSGLPLPRDAGLVLTTTASLTADPSGMPREPQR